MYSAGRGGRGSLVGPTEALGSVWEFAQTSQSRTAEGAPASLSNVTLWRVSCQSKTAGLGDTRHKGHLNLCWQELRTGKEELCSENHCFPMRTSELKPQV